MKIIAVTLREETVPAAFPFEARHYITDDFLRLADRCGVLLLPILSHQEPGRLAARCDGLIVTGSNTHIPPWYYGEGPEDQTSPADEYCLDRDLILEFAGENKPVLGICAGLQAMNAAFGGTLVRDLPNHDFTDRETHPVTVEPDTFLAGLYGPGTHAFNSFHTQAAGRVAPGFAVTARSADGVVEGIQRGSLIGVQWHPERMDDAALFRAFFALCGEKER